MASTSRTNVDNLDAMLKDNMPMKEYYIQGSVYVEHLEGTLERLYAMSDTILPYEAFEDHEMVFSIPKHLPPEMHMSLRLSRNLTDNDSIYRMRYLGKPEPCNSHTFMRTCINVGVTKEVVPFVSELGFDFDFDYVAKGYIFKKGIIKITISLIFKTSSRFRGGQLIYGDNLQQLYNQYFVQLSASEASGRNTSLAANMRQFAKDLEPFVIFQRTGPHDLLVS